MCLPTHRVLVRLYFCPASTCPGFVQDHACGRPRCFSLVMYLFLNAEERQAIFFFFSFFCCCWLKKLNSRAVTKSGECAPDADQADTLGNGIRTVHILSAIIAEYKGINLHSNSPNVLVLIFLSNMTNSIHLELSMRQIHATAENYWLILCASCPPLARLVQREPWQIKRQRGSLS